MDDFQRSYAWWEHICVVFVVVVCIDFLTEVKITSLLVTYQSDWFLA